MREIAEIQEAINETNSMLSKKRSDLSSYEDDYNSAVRNGDEELASHWKSQMRSAENRISELEGILADEQAELKSAQEASKSTDDSSTSTVNSDSSTSTVNSDSSTSTVNSDSSTSTINSDSSTSTVNSDSSTSTMTANYYVYTGGDQIISDYQSGEQIVLGTMPTGYIFGGGNFALTSATGNLFIANANDKIIDFVDAAGNPVIKAYAATNAGIIDGRGLAGYEYINGSDMGTDIIFAGDGGSQLWGGNGIDADVLVGGAGIDMFIGGKYQGADTFMNASSADVVFLNDATLSDIITAGEFDGTVALAFNTGNVVAVQSSETLSSAFVLADGSAYRYNHATKSWQSA